MSIPNEWMINRWRIQMKFVIAYAGVWRICTAFLLVPKWIALCLQHVIHCSVFPSVSVHFSSILCAFHSRFVESFTTSRDDLANCVYIPTLISKWFLIYINSPFQPMSFAPALHLAIAIWDGPFCHFNKLQFAQPNTIWICDYVSSLSWWRSISLTLSPSLLVLPIRFQFSQYSLAKAKYRITDLISAPSKMEPIQQ